jgi:Transposase DDE domain
MVAGKDVCLRRLARGVRAREVRFNRFLGNAKVTTERIIDSWSGGTGAAAEGRHVLAIQDTSEINFTTTAERRRGLGETAKGNVHGLLLHPMLAVDADNGTCLGLLSGQIWTRKGRRTVWHDRRELSDKESQRWIATALEAKPLLAKAAMVTALGDRESDIFALYASVAEQHFHVIARSMHDRKLVDDSGLYATSEAMAVVDQRAIVLPARAQRAERIVPFELRFGEVNLARPQSKLLRHLPESLPLNLVDVREVDPQAGTELLHWRLLTTHPVANAEQAWRIVDWYKQRWLIEQFFRILKTQGFRLEDSQLATADRLLKLVAIAAKAAVITLQLLQARDGRSHQPVRLAFDTTEVTTLAALNRNIEAQSKRLKNPHPPDSLAWAAWIIGRLGGWDGYPSSKPPGPITMKHGLEYFHAVATGWSLRDVCMP